VFDGLDVQTVLLHSRCHNRNGNVEPLNVVETSGLLIDVCASCVTSVRSVCRQFDIGHRFRRAGAKEGDQNLASGCSRHIWKASPNIQCQRELTRVLRLEVVGTISECSFARSAAARCAPGTGDVMGYFEVTAEIAPLQHARLLIAQSVVYGRPSKRPAQQLASTNSRKRMISPAVHESLARTSRERCIQEEKEAAVPFTRVPAKEAPRPRVSRTVSKHQTALTGNVPTGPVEVPR
jgi:hypothetical protein